MIIKQQRIMFRFNANTRRTVLQDMCLKSKYLSTITIENEILRFIIIAMQYN